MFYEPTRLVTHIDDYAIKALTQYYAKVRGCDADPPGFRRAPQGTQHWPVAARWVLQRCSCGAALSARSMPLAQVFPQDGSQASLLDICSSWVSHYPEGYKAARVAGLGMNGAELQKNAQLTEWCVCVSSCVAVGCAGLPSVR